MNKLNVVVLDNGMDVDSIPLNKSEIYALEVVDENGQYNIKNSIIREEKHGSMIIKEICSEVESSQIKIYSIRILEENLKCNLNKLLFALSYTEQYLNPDVINLSLGYKVDQQEIYNIILKLVRKDTIIITAFDNDDNNSYPAIYPEVIGVLGNDSVKDLDYYEYDNVNNNIMTYNGLRRYEFQGRGYRYISGNSIACARVTSRILNILCKKRLTYQELKKRLNAECIINLENKRNWDIKHNKLEKIILHPLNVKTLESIKKLSQYCIIYGFLDFRDFLFPTVADSNNTEYPIYKSFDNLPLDLEYIYVYEITGVSYKEKKDILRKIFEGALKIECNISFYEMPEEEFLLEFSQKFKDLGLTIEFVNVLEK